ncbi:MAG: hypothetical protein ACR2OI_08145 [Acidimicrobiia bacterium]
MSHQLQTPQDAHDIVEQFNAFHDGFIQSVTIRSHDHFTADGPEATDIAHHTSGAFDVEVEFAHYNYGGRLQPIDRRIRAVFADVQDLHLDLTGHTQEQWPIINVGFPPAETGFEFRIMRSRMVDGSWAHTRQTWFRFATAAFTEI